MAIPDRVFYTPGERIVWKRVDHAGKKRGLSKNYWGWGPTVGLIYHYEDNAGEMDICLIPPTEWPSEALERTFRASLGKFLAKYAAADGLFDRRTWPGRKRWFDSLGIPLSPAEAALRVDPKLSAANLARAQRRRLRANGVDAGGDAGLRSREANGATVEAVRAAEHQGPAGGQNLRAGDRA